RSSRVTDPPKVARAWAGRERLPARGGRGLAGGPGGRARRRSEQGVDAPGKREIGLREPALGVGRELEAHLVPAVHEDVRVVVGLLGQLGHAVHERDRGGEVRELQLARDRRLIVPVPVRDGGQALVDLGVAERGHATARLARPRGDALTAARPAAHARRRAAPYSLLMRIVSLVPHATELLFALGLDDEVVAVTHECDYPPHAAERPRVTRDVLPAGLSAREIDAAVRERTLAGEAIYELDRAALAAAR